MLLKEGSVFGNGPNAGPGLGEWRLRDGREHGAPFQRSAHGGIRDALRREQARTHGLDVHAGIRARQIRQRVQRAGARSAQLGKERLPQRRCLRADERDAREDARRVARRISAKVFFNGVVRPAAMSRWPCATIFSIARLSCVSSNDRKS